MPGFPIWSDGVAALARASGRRSATSAVLAPRRSRLRDTGDGASWTLSGAGTRGHESSRKSVEGPWAHALGSIHTGRQLSPLRTGYAGARRESRPDEGGTDYVVWPFAYLDGGAALFSGMRSALTWIRQRRSIPAGGWTVRDRGNWAAAVELLRGLPGRTRR